MKNFTIDAENNITTYASAEEAETAKGANRFSTAAELGALAANWPGERLVEIWNSLPGATAVKKFKDRKTAVSSPHHCSSRMPHKPQGLVHCDEQLLFDRAVHNPGAFTCFRGEASGSRIRN